MRILIFGDSIVYGGWDSHGGWADRLKRDYHQKYIETKDHANHCHQTLNLGIGGDTTDGLRKRIESEITARISPSWPLAIVISIGTNDSRGVDTPDNTQVPAERFKENTQAIIDSARKFTDRILFVGCLPMEVEELPFKNLFFNRSDIKRYDEIITEITRQNGVQKIETFDEFVQQDLSKLYSHDKLHPNDAGHELIYSLVKPELDKLLD